MPNDTPLHKAVCTINLTAIQEKVTRDNVNLVEITGRTPLSQSPLSLTYITLLPIVTRFPHYYS